MSNAIRSITAILFCVLVAACSSTNAPTLSDRSGAPVQIIFDTDFGGDADDLGAVAMLHYYADQGDIDLLAIVSWSHEEYALPALAAINQFYGRPGLQLGVREVDPWRTDWNYNKVIADQFPHQADTVADAEPAVALYRRLLANAAPNSITIVTVGPLANIQNLLNSEPDAISDKTGAELVTAKVDQFVIMGGQFPEGITAHGPEWNFDGNMQGVTQDVVETISRPIVFSGYEVGEALKYGAELNQHPRETPLYVGYKYFSEHAPWMKQDYQGDVLDNSSFDQTAVMYAAINGVGEHWTLSAPGKLSVDERGVGTWAEDQNGPHRFLVLMDQTEATVAEIAAAMTH